MHSNTNSTDISQFSTHLGWRPLCKYLPFLLECCTKTHIDDLYYL